jgi:hypothetical protein
LSVSKEQILAPLLDVLTKFRETIRVGAITNDSKAILAAADDLRDMILPDLGVRLEDKGSGNAAFQLFGFFCYLMLSMVPFHLACSTSNQSRIHALYYD